MSPTLENKSFAQSSALSPETAVRIANAKSLGTLSHPANTFVGFFALWRGRFTF